MADGVPQACDAWDGWSGTSHLSSVAVPDYSGEIEVRPQSSQRR